jgi:HD-like signal output (HDOD) protein
MTPNQHRLALCAPPAVRETLARSTRYGFMHYGRISPQTLETIGQTKVRGVLIHCDELETIELLKEAGDQACLEVPCLVLHQKERTEAIPNGWQRVIVSDLQEIAEVEEKLDRAMFLFPWFRRPALRRILSVLKKIPTEAASHQRIVTLLHDPEFSMETLTTHLKADPALTAQLLKIANSGAFARQTRVKNIEEAVAVLGSMRLQALISSAWAFFMIDDKACPGFHPKREWAHAVKIAEKARQLCGSEQLDEHTTETAVIAAMLHDIGKLLLAANLSYDYSAVLQDAEKNKKPCWQTENQMFGFNHAEIGGCLLAEWGLPLPIAEAVLYHHSEDQPQDSPAGLIQRVQLEVRNQTAPPAGQEAMLKVA